MIQYPDYLPLPEREGYEFQHISPFIRSQFVTGRARQRRRYTSVPSMLSLSWFFEKKAQAGLFEIWFSESLKDGADWFEMPLQTADDSKAFYQCRFADMYNGPVLIANDSWRITAVLEVKERPLLPSVWLDYPQGLLGADIIDIAANQEWPSENP